MNTKLVRLNSGEDIICDLIEDTDDSITMGNAIVAVPQGQGQLAFAPWSPLAKEDVAFTVPKSFVVYVSEPNPNITEQYEGMFATVITPQKKLIL
jgi:hypothetical protein